MTYEEFKEMITDLMAGEKVEKKEKEYVIIKNRKRYLWTVYFCLLFFFVVMVAEDVTQEAVAEKITEKEKVKPVFLRLDSEFATDKKKGS